MELKSPKLRDNPGNPGKVSRPWTNALIPILILLYKSISLGLCLGNRFDTRIPPQEWVWDCWIRFNFFFLIKHSRSRNINHWGYQLPLSVAPASFPLLLMMLDRLVSSPVSSNLRTKPTNRPEGVGDEIYPSDICASIHIYISICHWPYIIWLIPIN